MVPSNTIKHRRLVLVVEDQEINQGILEFILEDTYDIIFASNGVEALKQIEAHLQRLSIILLDLIMPVMDGFEVLERVRNSDDMRHIPIIVLTSEKEAELRALQLGAADFITKPFDAHEVILARVARIIELSEGRRLIQATEFDSITGLLTRGFFFEYAGQMHHFDPKRKMDALVLDIDRFHSINEMHGWESGNRTLALMGDAIRSLLDKTEGIGSRIEADQFYVYLPQQKNYLKILDTLQDQIDALSNRISIRVRMGVCPWMPKTDLHTMFEHAKTACGMARGSYKSNLMIYNDAIHERELYYQRLLNDLWHAVEDHQFKVYYQPKYNVQVSPPKLSSAEALVRWVHPELGMISPGDFIPLFERSGLIHVVDRYVWNEVAQQIARWRDKLGVEFPVSVNLSRMEILDPSIEDELTDLISSNNLSPKEFKLEVTESAYTDDADQLIESINKLRADGFEIEMDDFGSGYSSLNMISSLPIDVLKMDMKFIRDIKADRKAFHMVEVVLDIARYLGVPVVAEGVETDEQLELLQGAGCELVQGYYFSRPLPASEFEKLIIKDIEQHKNPSK